MRRAREDLAMAEVLMDGSSPAWGVCYHVQQAVEKALKALVVATGADPPLTHNLVRINATLEVPAFGLDDEDPLSSLTLWSVQQRYPADQPEPSQSDATEALNFGRRALAKIERRRAT